jgi:exodeoxyribonuclease V alpha subunit
LLTNEIEIVGTIKHVVYQNQENGYTVLKTKNDKTLCGTLYEVSANLQNAEFIAKGQWGKHKNFGPQFMFSEFQVNESKLFYFLSRIVRGLGRKLANNLIENYGEEELENILDKSPEILLTVKGIKHKKLKKITNSWHKFKHLKGIADVIIPYGGTQAIVNRIYRHFQDNPNIGNMLKENPYLMTEIRGIGFKTADRITLKMGISPDSMYRIKACINYIILNDSNTNGNSCIELEDLVKLCLEELVTEDSQNSVNSKQIQNAITELLEEKQLAELGNNRVTSAYLYFAEKFLLDTARNNQEGNIFHPDIDNYITNKEKEMNIQLGDEQKQAIYLANQGYRLFILCGYAGTGKSTISKAILDLVKTKVAEKNIICCALSGIAAERIRKTSGFQAFTIQSLLMKIEKDKDTLPYTVILIDESSMVNSEILYKLLKSIKEETIVIMVGDPAQLPPIGPGNPFSDLIQHQILPIIELKKIYRQSEEKVLTIFANQIREANVPQNFKRNYEDFEYIDVSIPNYSVQRQVLEKSELKKLRDENNHLIMKKILQLALSHKNKLSELRREKNIAEYIVYLQVISPIKNGILGVDNINNELQALLNPAKDENKIINLGLTTFHINDKVVHTSNMDMDTYSEENFKKKEKEKYAEKKRIFNGMIGIFFEIDKTEELLFVYYPNDRMIVEYTFDEARDLLQLAYSLTIHKTQGSEFQNIVIPITMSHFTMLNNKLLYTAITRAKTKCTLIGESFAFIRACKHKDATIRETVINQLVVE